MHQGDALGPVGFALGLEEALDKVQPVAKDIPWACWYLDDGTLVGDVKALAAYMEVLAPALASIGLSINAKKCSLWGPGLHCVGGSSPLLPETIQAGCLLRGVPLVPFARDQEKPNGITVLGVPVDAPGCHVMGHQAWRKAVESASRLLRNLRNCPDGQVRHCLMRYCLDACRVNHLMRGAPRASAGEYPDILSNNMYVACADLIGCAVPPAAWDQARLPISMGGLGIRDPTQCWAEARIAALANFHAKAIRSQRYRRWCRSWGLHTTH